MADKSYIGKGSVFLKVRGAAAAKKNVGNVHGLDLAVSTNKRQLADFESISGGLANSSSRIDTVTCTLQLRDVSADNLALSGLAKVTSVTAGAVTDEAHTAYKDGLIRTANNIDTTQTVTVTGTGGTPTYVADTDYTVRAAGVFILSGGSISDATAVEISYTKLAGSKVQFMVDSSKEYEITFAGLNEAQSGDPVTVDFWRFKPDPFNSLAFLGDDYATLEVPGELLRDTTITGADESQFFVAELAA